METGLTKNRIIAVLTKSPHGSLKEYIPIGREAARQEPEFLSHLIAWDRKNGQVRDAKAAMPIITLAVKEFPAELIENSLAHWALLNPREFLKAYRFSLEVRPCAGRGRMVRRFVADYLHNKEKNHWDRTAIQHRAVLKELYALSDTKPLLERTNVVLFGRKYDKTPAPLPRGSIFEAVANLKNMNPQEAAGTILEKKIPFLVARGALGAKAKEPDLVLALIERMSPTELVTNTKALEGLGIKTVPSLRAAFEQALGKAADSKKATLKTTRAAHAMGDESLKKKLGALQEKQLQNLGGIEGNWIILADKSGSMEASIETARHVAAVLSRMAKGTVSLIFFDTSPRFYDATGKTLEVIQAETRLVSALGGTSIGCGLQYAIERNLDMDGIAIVSDGEENQVPHFADIYARYVDKTDRVLPVYFYRTVLSNDQRYRLRMRYGGAFLDRDTLTPSMADKGFELSTFDIQKVDYYSIPDLAKTMRTNRYSLLDEIMNTPLLTLPQVFKGKEVEIHAD